MTDSEWRKAGRRKVSVGFLMKLAKDLSSDGGKTSKSEYDRGMVELVTDAAGLSMEMKREVARRIGITSNVD